MLPVGKSRWKAYGQPPLDAALALVAIIGELGSMSATMDDLASVLPSLPNTH